jgi:hypothetical protein
MRTMNRIKQAAGCAIPIIILASYGGQARADDAQNAQARRTEHMVLVDTIDVDSAKGLGVFDISFVDPTSGLYILADRTNASVDFFDTRSDRFIKRIGGFAGVVANPTTGAADSNLSGPDGVTVVANTQVWAGDGDSTLKVIDIASAKVIDTISTGGKARADEMAWDAADHILAVANDADTPPFITLINTDTHHILQKIFFDGTQGTPNATLTGIEQTQWSPETGQFYVSVPQITPSDPTKGGVAVINPASLSVTAVYPVSDCTPAGLALGPNYQALVGCSAAFGSSPNVVSQSLVINVKTGSIVKTIPEVGGSDEVWFDPGSENYYLAARSDTTSTGTVMPVLGTVDAQTNSFENNISTSTSAHSVAADSVTRRVFVPIGFPAAGTTDRTNPCPVVTRGCIAVYQPYPGNNSRSAQQ